MYIESARGRERGDLGSLPKGLRGFIEVLPGSRWEPLAPALVLGPSILQRPDRARVPEHGFSALNRRAR